MQTSQERYFPAPDAAPRQPRSQIKGQNKCQPGRPKQACPEGGSQDDVPQSLLQLRQINSDLQLGWHPGPQGRRETLTLHCTNTCRKPTATGKGEDEPLGEYRTLIAPPDL